MLRSDLCDYSDAYIAVEGIVTVEGTDDANKRNKKLVLKNNALFRSCISKKLVTDQQTMYKILMLFRSCKSKKLVTHQQTMQKILMLLYQYIIC